MESRVRLVGREFRQVVGNIGYLRNDEKFCEDSGNNEEEGLEQKIFGSKMDRVWNG